MTGPQLPGLEDEGAGGRYVTPLRSLEIKKCRTCNRDIIWTVSPSGARLPVDARPVQAHVYAIVYDSDVGPRAVKIQGVIDADWRAEDALETDVLFVSHWLTCPRPPARGGAAEAGNKPRPSSAARGHGGPAYVQGGNATARGAKAHKSSRSWP